MRVTSIGAVALACVVAPPLFGQVPTGRVQGRVVHATTQAGIDRAAVEAIESGAVAITDSSGNFVIDGLPVGIYRIRVRAIGFEPVIRDNVVVGSGKTAELTVRLRPLAVVLDAVVIEPSYFEPGKTGAGGSATLTAEETRRAPGVQEDVVRAVALLPGVGVTTGGRNDLIVRGGAPYENLFVVDGLPVPNINHFGSQGSTGGPLSLINIDMVERVEFATGGFSARYGNRTASVMELDLREGANDRIAGEVNVSATGAGAMLEGPAGATTFWLGARRSYLDLLFKAAGFSFVPSYWDFQAKTTTRLDARTTLSFLGVGALNAVTFFDAGADDRFDNSRILAPEQQQYFAGLTMRRLLADGVVTITAGRTYVRYDAEQRDSLLQPTFANRSREGQVSLRTDVVWQLTPRFELNLGDELVYASALDYDVTLDGRFRIDGDTTPQPLAVDTSFTALTNAAYVQGTYRLLPWLSWTAGARLSYYGLLDAIRVDPRVGLTFSDGATSAWVRAGRFHQSPSYVWLIGDPENVRTLEPISADHLIVGASHDPASDLRVQFEAYYKRYRSYPARTWRPQAVLAPTGFEDVTADIPFGLEPLDARGKGRVFGAELLVRKKLGRVPVFGLASAAVMRAEFAGADGTWRAGSYDVRAIANLLIGWRPNRSWELSGKFRFATGLPSTPFVTAGPLAGQLDFSRYNAGARLPVFHALDVRVDRRWSFQGWQLVLYLDVQNAYGRSNVSAFRWNARTQSPEADESLGVLPSIGVNVEF